MEPSDISFLFHKLAVHTLFKLSLYFKAMLKKRNMENKIETKGPQFGLCYSAK